MHANVITGDCLTAMPTLDANSVDAIVTDPPYGLAFMGKGWDHAVPGAEFWAAALRVAKPGAYLVAFGGTRTYHRLTCAIEDAGWEIRDSLCWLYGSGFPKSLDVGKAIDKAAGHWRGRASVIESENGAMAGPNYGRTDKGEPVTDAASAWDGWGTALKPAWEPIILARKPPRQTVAANVLQHGTGALNIDGCRIEFASRDDQAAAAAAAQRSCRDQNAGRTAYGEFNNGEASLAPYLAGMDKGRWPANVLLDTDSAVALDEMSGVVGGGTPREGGTPTSFTMTSGRSHADSGGASRFFYTAKASRSERNAGLDATPLRQRDETRDETRDADLPGGNNPRNRGARAVANNHPTVKPLDLMQWLCRLVTPRGGLILDPFTGSGTTGRAAVAEGFRFLGIERDPDYAEIARARIAEYAPLFAGGAA